MTQCNNDMVKTCINHAMQKANSPLGSNLAFFRHKFTLDVFQHTLKHCIIKTQPIGLDASSEAIIDVLHTLMLARCNIVFIDDFTSDDVITLINGIASS